MFQLFRGSFWVSGTRGASTLLMENSWKFESSSFQVLDFLSGFLYLLSLWFLDALGHSFVTLLKDDSGEFVVKGV